MDLSWVMKFLEVAVIPILLALGGIGWKLITSIKTAFDGRVETAEKSIVVLRNELGDYKLWALQHYALRTDMKEIENEIKASFVRFETKLDRILEGLHPRTG